MFVSHTVLLFRKAKLETAVRAGHRPADVRLPHKKISAGPGWILRLEMVYYASRTSFLPVHRSNVGTA